MTGERKKNEAESTSSRILGATLATTAIKPLVVAYKPLLPPAAPVGWDAAVAAYHRQPSDQALDLMQATYQHSKEPRLAETVLSVAIGKDTPMFVRHLAIALFVDRRLLEADHFATRWTALEPENFYAHNLKAIICVERLQLRTAIDHYNRMGPMRPDSIEVARLRLMLYLRTDQLGNAQEHARMFVMYPDLTPMDILLVAETGIRACDPDLVSAAVLRRPSPYNERTEHLLREVARCGLLGTLAARVAA